MAGSCARGHDPSGAIKDGQFLEGAKRLSASQEAFAPWG